MDADMPMYYAIIPAEVRYDKTLTPLEKLLYAEITALSNKEGYCWASNKYFADFFDRNDKYISGVISNLAKKGHIRVEIDKGAGNFRKIYIGRQVEVKTYSDKNEQGSSEKAEQKEITISRSISKKTSYTDEDIRLVELFYDLQIQNNPMIKRACNEKNFFTMNRIHRIDGVDYQTIEGIIRWVAQDEFWKDNVEGITKLRVKLPTLYGRAKSDLQKRQVVVIS